MSREAEDSIAGYAASGVLLDTNLLVLFVIGKYDPGLISSFKRTRVYTTDDFHTLVALLSFFRKIVVTPPVLAETSNLLGQLPAPLREKCFRSTFFELTQQLNEYHVASATAAQSSDFIRFGLVDAGIASLAGQYLVVTDDFPLAGLLSSREAPVINFTHLRSF